jgi:hypothetical protein
MTMQTETVKPKVVAHTSLFVYGAAEVDLDVKDSCISIGNIRNTHNIFFMGEDGPKNLKAFVGKLIEAVGKLD